MLKPRPFVIHTPNNCPPFILPNGGNGKYKGPVQLTWRTAGQDQFTLRFYEEIGGEPTWPFEGDPKPMPTAECEVTWNAERVASFKYDVVIGNDTIDPMLVFDRQRQRMPMLVAVAAAIITGVIGFLIGRGWQ